MTEPTAPGPGDSGTTGTSAPGAPGQPDLGSVGQSGQTETDPQTAAEDKRLAAENATWRNKVRKLEQELEKARGAAMSEQEKALAAAKVEGATEYRTKWADALRGNAALALLGERQVIATDLALRGLDLSEVDVDLDTGKVDVNAITKLVDALIERYPMLVSAQAQAQAQQLAQFGSLSGADQRRVQTGQISRPAQNGANTSELNKLARYALGGGD